MLFNIWESIVRGLGLAGLSAFCGQLVFEDGSFVWNVQNTELFPFPMRALEYFALHLAAIVFAKVFESDWRSWKRKCLWKQMGFTLAPLENVFVIVLQVSWHCPGSVLKCFLHLALFCIKCG